MRAQEKEKEGNDAGPVTDVHAADSEHPGEFSDDHDQSSFPETQNLQHLMNGDARTEVHKVATYLQTQNLPFSVANTHDAALDPDSPSFNVDRWINSFLERIAEKGIGSGGTGVAFRNLDVLGPESPLLEQETVWSLLTSPLRLRHTFSPAKKEPRHILNRVDGLLRPREMLLVLGRPGAGCSTLLRTVTGQLHGLSVGESSSIHYDGVSQKRIGKEFRGAAVYNEEVCSVKYRVPDASQVLHLISNCSRSITTSLISLSARHSSLRLRCVFPTVFSEETTEQIPSPIFRESLWPFSVSAIQEIPKWATMIFLVCLVANGSESVSPRCSSQIRWWSPGTKRELTIQSSECLAKTD